MNNRMNIVEIKTGNNYDPEYSEYIFKTNRPRRDIYDENHKLTHNFLDWLRMNHPIIYNDYFYDRESFEVNYINRDDIELIEF